MKYIRLHRNLRIGVDVEGDVIRNRFVVASMDWWIRNSNSLTYQRQAEDVIWVGRLHELKNKEENRFDTGQEGVAKHRVNFMTIRHLLIHKLQLDVVYIITKSRRNAVRSF